MAVAAESPLYERLAHDLGASIAKGQLRAGDRLPSVRRLARERSVSVATVLQAYFELENEGLVEVRPKSGHFVRRERGPELLLMERAGSLRSHAGQPSFPGGALDPEDGDPQGDGPLRAALREAEEETGLDPAGVQIFGVLPKLYIPVSGFVVTPVLGWWRKPSPVGVVDPAETARDSESGWSSWGS